jgi:hypothetical protein
MQKGPSIYCQLVHLGPTLESTHFL